MNKLLFLDIDGVMNSTYGDHTNIPREADMEVDKLLLLSKLLKETGAGLVLISDRRYFDSYMVEFKNVLLKYDISLTGVIRNPDSSIVNDSRGLQIQDYLTSLSEEITNIVILDDNDEGISGLFPNEYIQVNRFFGMNKEVVRKIKNVLK